jgi:DNA-binding IclR family transcriptional regulator
MNRYNELKFRTLSEFAGLGGEWRRPIEIAEQLGFLPRRSMWTYLKRLWRFGLLERRTRGRGTLEYKLSKAGAARIQRLRGSR